MFFKGSTPNHNHHNRRGRGGRGRGPTGREVPKDDFDFQVANDGFDKDALEEEFQSKLKIADKIGEKCLMNVSVCRA